MTEYFHYEHQMYSRLCIEASNSYKHVVVQWCLLVIHVHLLVYENSQHTLVYSIFLLLVFPLECMRKFLSVSASPTNYYHKRIVIFVIIILETKYLCSILRKSPILYVNKLCKPNGEIAFHYRHRDKN